MTQIIAGKLEGFTFMMSDCISNGETKRTIVDKVMELSSSENVYFSLTGSVFIFKCVNEYDYWLSVNGQVNDFIDGENSINKLLEVIDIMYKYEVEILNNRIKFRQNRLFFINNENVIYYDIYFVMKNETDIESMSYTKNILEINQFVDSMLNSPVEAIPVRESWDKDLIKEFCLTDFKNIIKL